MTRVAKVLWAAAKRKRKSRRQGNANSTLNPNADSGLAAAMRKTHSYEWLQNAVEDTPDSGCLTPSLSLSMCVL